MVITIRGKNHWLWRGVDQFGIVLDVLVQNRRDRYAAANKDMGLKFEHRQHKGLNNRAHRCRYNVSAVQKRANRSQAMAAWEAVTCANTFGSHAE